MTGRQPSIQIYVLPASASPLALVIRKGPAKTWHFLLWDRDSGMVRPGSWFTGLIYPWACDLSPKGDWFVLLAYRGGNEPRAWTALCQPPSASAIVFWPLEHARAGGGFFDNRLSALWLNVREDRNVEIRGKHPWEFGYLEGEAPVHYGSVEEKLLRDGWKAVKGAAAEECRWRKQSPSKKSTLTMTFLGTTAELLADPSSFHEPSRVRYNLAQADGAEQELAEVTWAGYNTRGELCFVRDGGLWTARESGPSLVRPVMEIATLSPRPKRIDTSVVSPEGS